MCFYQNSVLATKVCVGGFQYNSDCKSCQPPSLYKEINGGLVHVLILYSANQGTLGTEGSTLLSKFFGGGWGWGLGNNFGPLAQAHCLVEVILTHR